MEYLESQRRRLIKIDEALDGLDSGTLTIKKACEITGFIHGGTRQYLIHRLVMKRKQVQRTIEQLERVYGITL